MCCCPLDGRDRCYNGSKFTRIPRKKRAAVTRSPVYQLAVAKVEKLRHITCFIKPSEFWMAEASRTLVSGLSLAQHSGVGILP